MRARLAVHRGRIGLSRAWDMGSGAAEGYEWFFRSEYPQVVRTAYLVLQEKEGARDVAQEAFIQLLRHWEKVSRYDKPEAWVRRVAIRLAVKSARKQRFQTAFSDDIDVPTITATRDPDLMKAVGTLPSAQRAAVVLFYFEDRPVSEVAEIMDCSQSTAKVHLHRARKKLAEALGEEVAIDVS